ncbi:MAG: HEAT repeat domain-containing protein, partial [Bacteroidota bacterium]
MLTHLQRRIGLVLFIALSLQSCGVDVPVERVQDVQLSTVQGRSMARLRAYMLSPTQQEHPLSYRVSFDKMKSYWRRDTPSRARERDSARPRFWVQRGTPIQRAFSYVERALADCDSSVRSAAIGTLMTWIEKGVDVAQVLPYLQHALQDKSNVVRITALETLGPC